MGTLPPAKSLSGKRAVKSPISTVAPSRMAARISPFRMVGCTRPCLRSSERRGELSHSKVERSGRGGTSLDQFGLSSGRELSPPSRTARRFAPGIETSLRASGARRQVPMRRYLLVKGGRAPPFTHSPRTRRRRTSGSPPFVWRGQLRAACPGTPVVRPAPRPAGPRDCEPLIEKKRGDGLERRPVGSSPGGARRRAGTRNLRRWRGARST